MCWSLQASAVLAVAGAGTAVWTARRGEPRAITATLVYFAIMEGLQAATWPVIDRCELPANQVLTLLGYLHIAFQPVCINAFSLCFVPQAVARRVAPWAYGIAAGAGVLMVVQLYPFEWAGNCRIGRPLCGEGLCSLTGSWHLAWSLPVNGIGNDFGGGFLGWFFDHGFPGYAIAGFLLPFLYGAWRITAFHYLLGPGLAHLLTDDPREWPAVWCLLSIGIVLIALLPQVRPFLCTRTWPLWPRRLEAEPEARVPAALVRA
jgi:hypothetical protein